MPRRARGSNGLDETPRSVKRRKLETEDDGFQESTIKVKSIPDVSAVGAAKRGRRTSGKVPASSAENVLRANDDEVQSVDLGASDGQQEACRKKNANLTSEVGPTAEGTTNGDVTKTPYARRRERQLMNLSPQEVRLSDLIREAGNDVPKQDEVTASTPSTRQSGRERRKPRRYSNEMAPIEKPNLINGLSARNEKGGRPRKVVTFQDDIPSQNSDQMGFKDIRLEERNGQSDPAEEVNGTGEVVETLKQMPLKRKRGRPKKDRATDAPSEGLKEQSDPSEDHNGIVPTLKDVNLPQSPLKRKRTTPKKDSSTDIPQEANKQIKPIEESNGTVEVVETVRAVNSPQSRLKRRPARPRTNVATGRDHTGLEESVAAPQSTIDPTEDEVVTAGEGSSPTDLFSRFKNDPESEQALFSIKKMLLEKITGKRRLPLVGLEEEYRKVHQVVSQTVLAGEGNSLLVIGARGSGKSTVVETVIDDLSADHKTDFHVVRLNGFIHTDDKLALREIWRQLGREMEVEEEGVGTTTNHADILSSLLALLSHPSELSANETRSEEETAKSVIFILDEFDLFASHPRQTLLYNLFDIAQARKAPVAVLGLTTRISAVESLEKRVKSRFSHRYVHISLPKSPEAFWEICHQALVITEEEAIELEKLGSTTSNLITAWNQSIQDLATHSAPLKHLLQQTYTISKSPQDILTSLLTLLISLTPSNLPFTPVIPPNTTPNLLLQPPPSNLHLLPSLTDLQLSLLISAARLEHILNTDTCTFHMVYDEYVRLVSTARASSSTSAMITSTTTTAANLSGSARVWGKDVAKTAWEGLAQLGLVVPAAVGGVGVAQLGGAGGGAAGGAATMWKVDVALEEIPPAVPGLPNLLARWCREI